jgi:hypothetical protein
MERMCTSKGLLCSWTKTQVLSKAPILHVLSRLVLHGEYGKKYVPPFAALLVMGSNMRSVLAIVCGTVPLVEGKSSEELLHDQ